LTSIINDSIDEDDETVLLSLSGPVNATLGSPASSTLTIVDDDPTVYFGSSSYSVLENAGKATITVLLSAAPIHLVTVNYATANGTATAAEDYIATSGTVTFPIGQTSATFDVWIVDDNRPESNETVNLTLSNPSNAFLGSPITAILTITEVTPTTNLLDPGVRTNDALQGYRDQFGATLLDPQFGALHVPKLLDFRNNLDSCTCGQFTLAYNSNTVSVRPIVETIWDTSASLPVPTLLKGRLTWNNGTPGSWVSFGTGGTARRRLLAGAQVADAVTTTDRYSWKVRVPRRVRRTRPVYRFATGNADVVSLDNSPSARLVAG
jgi:hypothetical protein